MVILMDIRRQLVKLVFLPPGGCADLQHVLRAYQGNSLVKMGPRRPFTNLGNFYCSDEFIL